jgi:hypothetical protein
MGCSHAPLDHFLAVHYWPMHASIVYSAMRRCVARSFIRDAFLALRRKYLQLAPLTRVVGVFSWLRFSKGAR